MVHSRWSRRGGIGLAVAALALAAVGGGASVAQVAPTVYIIAPSLTDPFWITEKNGADQAAADFGVNVIFQAPAQDTGDAGMAQMALGAIGAQPNGIAIDYTSKAMEEVTVAALDAGLAVVLYNNNRFEGENAPADPRIAALAFSGQDEGVSGEILADNWASNLATPGCKVLIVNPFPTAFVLTLRGDGAKRSLDNQGFTYEDLAATGDQGQNEGLIGAKLQADPSICGIVALGNPAANPASKYVSENGLSIPIATFDVGAEAATWIEKGVLTMAINQQPFLQSYFAVANLNNWLKYSLSPVNVNTGTSLVTQDNIATIKACIAAGRC